MRQASIASLDELVIDPSFFESFSRSELQYDRVIPVFSDGDGDCFAVDTPEHPMLFRYSESLENMLLYHVSSEEMDAFWACRSQEISGQTPAEILDEVLAAAISKSASDVHCYRRDSGYHLVFRIDGTLLPYSSVPNALAEGFRNVVEIRAELDISQVLMPQDGRIQFFLRDKAYDFRVASMPSVNGTDFVFRLMQNESLVRELGALGFSSIVEQRVASILGQSHGLFLVTGPTGSGKTSSLYAALGYLKDHSARHIVTLEDPVESRLEGIRQSQIHDSIGYGFCDGLKAALRQDPDVIMVGEIRDKASAQIALEAAYTGHLVLSSLHTSDVKSSLLRLGSFGLDPFLIQHSLLGVLSQKLYPKRCLNCGGHAMGCHECGHRGYSGRQVVSELLDLSECFGDVDLSDWDEVTRLESFIPFEEDFFDKAGGILV